VQKCRKNAPFSPQARWGDDGVRQVLKHGTGLACGTHSTQPMSVGTKPDLCRGKASRQAAKSRLMGG